MDKMRYTNAIIRTKEQLKTSKKEIVKALLEETKNKKKRTFPVYYKYLEESRPKGVFTPRLRPDESQKIGTMTDIRIADNGDIIATVNTQDVLSVSDNFSGVIDNIVVTIINTGVENHGVPQLSLDIQYGIVYDKFAKKVIDTKKETTHTRINQSEPSPKPDYVIPGIDYNPLSDPRVMDEIHEEMEKELGGEIHEQSKQL